MTKSHAESAIFVFMFLPYHYPIWS